MGCGLLASLVVLFDKDGNRPSLVVCNDAPRRTMAAAKCRPTVTGELSILTHYRRMPPKYIRRWLLPIIAATCCADASPTRWSNDVGPSDPPVPTIEEKN
jgi:hypothetical protein